MIRSIHILIIGAALAAVTMHPVNNSAESRGEPERLSLDEARAYMVDLINRDRAAKRLAPVELDAVASLAGQRHAEEMAAARYLSHFDLTGKPPDQRYTEAGGRAYARENVYLSTTRYGGVVPDDSILLPLRPEPTYTAAELEEIEASYFNEAPPSDGHRRNILASEHTHVGIGLARAGAADLRTLANAQEFTDHYVEVDPIPREVRPSTEVRVAGTTLGSATIESVSVGRTALPAPMDRKQLAATHSYSIPAARETYWPPPIRSPRRIQIGSGGRFSVSIPLGDDSDHGLYYIGVWVEVNGRATLASLRTVVVR